ncbi:electron transfer flavoprotein subunit beta/FixA family protein [Halalkalibacter sp. APA_J-10(15)]|uniref:electron transfer flavoprotein subunit beta/FixA family protein n=1 Tax=Halalkalibacter sp. APA_J-10(15) TaxID=2933805 RepID=UPI001FF2A0AE|nr:electron transfer flavoprotein subunit beta/FixA family protein [Halalkalibacter sp. APA_J-10(15)]MCK0470972.1 electron transfer flavoprotein subunit beta/FixA family protein [Halalkalibacter sp. APA_J-10(15)]
MNIFVLLKQTFDTEEKIIIENGIITEDDAQFVINPYDEYAVEEAIRQRDEHGGNVTVLSVGPERTSDALRTALAMGVDEAIHLLNDDIPEDASCIAKVLSAFLQNKDIDLILGGYFSIDNGDGQVAIRLAHALDLPHVSSITSLSIQEGTAQVIRDAEGDLETINVTLPALFTAQQGLNEPRYPSLPGIMKAKRKPLKELLIDDLHLASDDLIAKTTQQTVFLPPKKTTGVRLNGAPDDQVKSLIAKLQEQIHL